MNNLELIKKNLFKVKKVNILSKNNKGEVVDSNECVAILVPSFNNFSNTFSDSFFTLINVDGTTKEVNERYIEISNTRITDSKLKEKLENIIEFAKENYKFQKEKAKFYEELRKKENALREKTSKQNDKMKKLIDELKKSQGILSYREVLSSLKVDSVCKKDGSWELTDSGTYINGAPITAFGFDIENNSEYDSEYKEIEAVFSGKNILEIRFKHILKTGNYATREYDFTYEEYDGACGVCTDLEKSKDFNTVINNNFKSAQKSKLDEIEAKEKFNASISTKNAVIFSHEISLDFNLECNKGNMKVIKDRFNALLKLI